jgi:serine/threonine protein kinase
VKEALGKLHAEGFVHGDVRDANILVDSNSLEGDVKIHIIDWDWAGHAGEVRYPPGINRFTMERLEGAQTSQLIAKEHDLEMVDYIR